MCSLCTVPIALQRSFNAAHLLTQVKHANVQRTHMYDDVTLHAIEPAPSTRTSRLRHALQAAQHSVPVTLTAMRRSLTSAEFRAYQDACLACYPRPTVSERHVLRQYNHDLRQGDLQYAIARKLGPVGPAARKRHLHMRKAQQFYCRALESLHELVDGNPLLVHLFDRVVADGKNADEPEGMPRYVNCASEHGKRSSEHPHTADVTSLQASALRDSLEALESGTRQLPRQITTPKGDSTRMVASWRE